MERTARSAANATAEGVRGGPSLAMDNFFRHFNTHHHEIRRSLHAMQVPEADLDSVADKVFDAAVTGWSEFDGEDLRGWLRGIARNKARSYHRRAWLRRKLLWWYQADVPGASQNGLDPEQAATRKQDQALVHEVLSRMSKKLSTALILFEIEGLSLREIADHEGIPEGTVKTRLFNAREQFRLVLRKMDQRKGVSR